MGLFLARISCWKRICFRDIFFYQYILKTSKDTLQRQTFLQKFGHWKKAKKLTAKTFRVDIRLDQDVFKISWDVFMTFSRHFHQGDCLLGSY